MHRHCFHDNTSGTSTLPALQDGRNLAIFLKASRNVAVFFLFLGGRSNYWRSELYIIIIRLDWRNIMDYLLIKEYDGLKSILIKKSKLPLIIKHIWGSILSYTSYPCLYCCSFATRSFECWPGILVCVTL